MKQISTILIFLFIGLFAVAFFTNTNIIDITRKKIWIEKESGGIQCEKSIFLANEHEAKQSLESAGIKVFKSDTKYYDVRAVCGAPEGTFYLLKINLKDLKRAQSLNWHLSN